MPSQDDVITALKGSPYDPHKTAEQRKAEEHLDVDAGEGGDGVNNLYRQRGCTALECRPLVVR